MKNVNEKKPWQQGQAEYQWGVLRAAKNDWRLIKMVDPKPNSLWDSSTWYEVATFALEGEARETANRLNGRYQ